MPKTGTGFLIDPTGHEPMALDEEDYERIRQYLHVRHSANDETCEAIDWLLHLSTEHTGMDDEEIFIWMVRHYLSDADRDHFRGVLAGRLKDAQIQTLSEQQLEILENTFTAIRAGGWFAEWLTLQVGIIAKGQFPDACYPTPLKIAASLVDCIREHEDTMKAAREVVRMRPDLLQQLHMPIYPIREATQKPPAAPEAAQPTRKGTTDRPRARKASRKKAGRAV